MGLDKKFKNIVFEVRLDDKGKMIGLWIDTSRTEMSSVMGHIGAMECRRIADILYEVRDRYYTAREL